MNSNPCFLLVCSVVVMASFAVHRVVVGAWGDTSSQIPCVGMRMRLKVVVLR